MSLSSPRVDILYLNYTFYLFLIFNFINREISNILLVVLLGLCFYTLFKNKIVLDKYDKRIISYVVLFSLWIIVINYYHSAPTRHIDDYIRYLFLLPIYLVFVKSNNNIAILKFVLKICALCVVGHYLYSHNFLEFNRYMGTSSTSISYAYIVGMLALISFYILLEDHKKNIYDYFLVMSTIILFYICFLLESKGVFLSLTICLLIMVFFNRHHNKGKLILFVGIILVTFFNTTLIDRFSKMYKFLDLYLNNNPNVSTKVIYRNDESTYTRLKMLEYGIDTVKINPIAGIGANKLEEDLFSKFKEYDIKTTITFDHLHNDLIDIPAKFGLPALLLILLIYYSLMRKFIITRNRIGYLILLYFILSQLTQSHYTHNQPIVFTICFLYFLNGYNFFKRKN